MEYEDSGAPSDLLKFINMRLNSAFFDDPYKETLRKAIVVATETKDWKPVELIMWPMTKE